MSKKEEIAKLKEEIKLQELKLKKLELENKLDTDQEKVGGQTVYKFLGEFEFSLKESDDFVQTSVRKNTRVYLS